MGKRYVHGLLSPEWLASLAVLGASVFWGYYAYSNSWFINDDLQHFVLALHSELLQYILTPIDIHFVPFHRLVNYLLLRVAPMNFPAALVFMLTIHLATIYYLYRLLEALVPGKLNLLFLLLYAANPNIYSVLSWWSAGLHRFPYVFLSAASMYHFAAYLYSGSGKKLLLSAAFFLLALGFYAKAVLIPGYLICLCLVRQILSPSDRFSRGLLAGFLLLLLSGVYAVWLLYFRETGASGLSANTAMILQSWLHGMSQEAQSLVPVTYLLFMPGLVIGIWAFVITAMSWKRGKILLLWLLGLACIGANVLAISVSSRVDISLLHAAAPNHYFDVVFIQIVFLAIICHQYFAGLSSRPFFPGSTGRAAITLAFFATYMAFSVNKAIDLARYRSASHLSAAVYAKNLDAELTDFEQLDDINLHDEPVPRFLTQGLLNRPIMLSTFLALYQRGMPNFDRADMPLFRVNREGHIVPFDANVQ